MSDYRSVVQRQLVEIAAARAASAAPLKAATSAEEFLGIPFTPGQRVMDSQTGSAGMVRAGAIVHRVVAAPPAADGSAGTPFFNLPNRVDEVAISVQLDEGTIVVRAPKELIALPASLIVPLAQLEPLK